MRSLEKHPEPAVLRDNHAEWTRAYVAAPVDQRARYEKWRHKEIKDALSQETGRRCAYCEAFIDDVAYPNVEHIVPKSVRPDLSHHWPNLTYCCGRCNTEKREYYSEVLPIVNPYTDDPEDHIRFLGNLADNCLGSMVGKVTIRKLDLNRLQLCHSRRVRIEAIRALLDQWHTSEGPERTFFEEGIRVDAQEGEFPATVFAYLRSYGFPI